MLTGAGSRLGGPYAALSFTFLFNLVTITPFSPWLGTNLVAANPTDAVGLALKGLALACAAVNVALLAALVRRQAAAP